MNDRIRDMIQKYQILNPKETITENTLIKGTSIKKLCEFEGPGYKRVKDWINKKVNELPKIDIINKDMSLAKEEFRKCFDLMQGRNQKYGDSWKQLRTNSIIDLMVMKLDRCKKQELDSKALEVEIEDIVNYGIFTLIKIRNNI